MTDFAHIVVILSVPGIARAHRGHALLRCLLHALHVLRAELHQTWGVGTIEPTCGDSTVEEHVAPRTSNNEEKLKGGGVGVMAGTGGGRVSGG